MARKSNKSIPYKVASAAVWLVVIPAVVIAQVIRGERPFSAKPNSNNTKK